MPSILDASGQPFSSAPNLNGSTHRRASFLEKYSDALEQDARDPALRQAGNPPNFGRYPLPHMLTFQSIVGTVSKVFRQSDEALKHSEDNARYMRNDCGVMECLEARQRGSALLGWHLEPEDEKSQDQKTLCEALTKILERMKRFTEYRRVLLEAIWYGRYAVQHSYKWVNIGGRMYVMPAPDPNEHEGLGWLPINGDKLVFRYDDGDPDLAKRPNQVGIRVGAKRTAGDRVGSRPWTVEATDRGLAYFLDPWERPLLAIHKHQIEDGTWDDPHSAGFIHGVGVRSRIYWDWFQKQESLAFLMEYLERSAGGIEVWSYPEGNPQGLDNIKEAASQRVSGGRNILFFPKPAGDDAAYYDVNVIEPGMAGIESLKDLLVNYFGHRIKRYILGQILTSEAEATGLGSGVADIHMDSFLQIISYDCRNLDETITDQLVEPIKNWNFPRAKGTRIRYVTETDEPDVKEKLEGVHSAWEMGARIKERDVMDMIGLGIPTADDRVLQNPAIQQAAMQQQARQGQGQARAMGVGFGDGKPQQAPSEDEIADQATRALFADPENLDAQTVTYANEGGEWVQREVPSAEFDTGDRERDAYSRQWSEKDHPRAEDGTFIRRFPKDSIANERAELNLASDFTTELVRDIRENGWDREKLLEVLEKETTVGDLVKGWKKAERRAMREADKLADEKDEIDGEFWEEYALGLLFDHWASREHVADLLLKQAEPDRYARDPDEAAKLTNTDPSDPQKDAGNYQKGKFWWRGLEISIENPKGSIRRGVAAGGEPWEVTMPVHYGYIRRTEGADGDQVDCFVGPARESGKVFVVDQQTAAGRFDEHKVLIGFGKIGEACDAYLGSYSDDATSRIGSITPLTVEQFKDWLRTGDQSKRISAQVSKLSRTAA